MKSKLFAIGTGLALLANLFAPMSAESMARFSRLRDRGNRAVLRLNQAPSAYAGKFNPGRGADAIVGTYDAGHGYHEKTPPSQQADRNPQIYRGDFLNRAYLQRGKVLQVQRNMAGR